MKLTISNIPTTHQNANQPSLNASPPIITPQIDKIVHTNPINDATPSTKLVQPVILINFCITTTNLSIYCIYYISYYKNKPNTTLYYWYNIDLTTVLRAPPSCGYAAIHLLTINKLLSSNNPAKWPKSSCLSSCFSLLTFHAELHADYSYRQTVRHQSVLPDL